MDSSHPPAQLLSDLSRELTRQLVGESPEPDLDEVAIDVAWDYFENDTDPDDSANDFVDDVLPRYRRCVVGFGYSDGPDTGLDLLDLSTNSVFVLVDRTSIDEGTRVIGEFQRDDTEGLAEFLRSEIRFGACTGENLSAWPEFIEISEPLTEDDVRSALVPLLTEYAGEAERFAEIVGHATGSTWPIQSKDDRHRLAQAYVSLALGLTISTEPTGPCSIGVGHSERPDSDDDVVGDPVSGRPLHEFVVPALGAPAVLPTEGEPLQEPGNQQGPNEKPRGKPKLVFTVEPNVDLDEAADLIATMIINARSKRN